MNRSYVDHLVMNNDKLLNCMQTLIVICMNNMDNELSTKVSVVIKSTLDSLDPLEEGV